MTEYVWYDPVKDEIFTTERFFIVYYGVYLDGLENIINYEMLELGPL